MEAWILNDKFETVQVIDSFKSFIWTDRYQECGDFELILPLNEEVNLTYVKRGYYFYNADSEHIMMIENFLVTTDLTEGNTVKITGESLESILKRRIIWDPIAFTGGFQNMVKTLLNDSIINPKDLQRKIDNFTFKDSTDARITSLTVDRKYEDRENLYEAIVSVCQEKEIGWKVILTDDHKFEFSLYKGVDRSYAQIPTPWVIFSPTFENLVDSEYLENDEDYLNVCLVTGEDTDNRVEDRDPPILHTVIGHHVGLDRRETYVDAGSLTSEEDGVTLTSEEKYKMMEQAGNEELADHKQVKALSGNVDPYSMFQYGRDYFIGDLVQIENIFGFKGTSTISEYIMSYDTSGYKAYPTFTEFKQEE